MADFEDFGSNEAVRLERALERIARVRQRGDQSTAAAAPPDVAARLDALIAELRAVLKKDGGD